MHQWTQKEVKRILIRLRTTYQKLDQELCLCVSMNTPSLRLLIRLVYNNRFWVNSHQCIQCSQNNLNLINTCQADDYPIKDQLFIHADAANLVELISNFNTVNIFFQFHTGSCHISRSIDSLLSILQNVFSSPTITRTRTPPIRMCCKPLFYSVQLEVNNSAKNKKYNRHENTESFETNWTHHLSCPFNTLNPPNKNHWSHLHLPPPPNAAAKISRRPPHRTAPPRG